MNVGPGSALGYAPIRRTRTLKEWARDPLGALSGGSAGSLTG